MARPKLKIDPVQVEKMAAINCTMAEIAAVMGCDVKTIFNRFSKEYAKGKEIGKMSLRRKMWETAMGGNVTMMIWMSKQILDYTEKQEIKNDVVQNIKVQPLSKEELKAAFEADPMMKK